MNGNSLPLAISILLSLLPCPGFAQTFEDCLTRLPTFGVRSENGEGERSAISYIVSELSGERLRPRVLELAASGEIPHSFSSSVEFVVPGVREDRLIVVVPLGQDGVDGQYDFSLACALALAKETASGEAPPVTMVFLFAGAMTGEPERSRGGPNDRYLLGARRYIDGMPAAARSAVIGFSMEGVPSVVGLGNFASRNVSPYWYYERALAASHSSGIPFRYFESYIQIYRLGLNDRNTAISPWLARSIPAIELSDEESGSDPRAAYDGVRAFVLGLARASADGFPERWDRQYAVIGVFGSPWILTEGVFVRVLLFGIALISLFFLVGSLVARAGFKVVAHLVPAILGKTLLFCATFSLSIGLSYLSFFLARLISGYDAFWLSAPAGYLIALLSVALFTCFALVQLLVRFRLLSINPSYYHLAACIALFVDVLAGASLSLSVAAFFLVTLVLLMPVILARKRLLSAFFYVLAFVPGILVALAHAGISETGVFAAMLFPDASGLVVLFLGMLPYVFLVSAIAMQWNDPEKMKKKRYFVIPLLFALFTMVWMPLQGVIALASQPVRDVAIREFIDEDTDAVRVRCDRSDNLPLSLERDGTPLVFPFLGDAVTERTGGEGATLVAIRESRSLSRRVMTFTFDFPERPKSVSLELASDEEIIFHDSNFPFVQSLDGRTVTLSVGSNPPRSLELRAIVDVSFEGSLRLTTRYGKAFGNYESFGRHEIRGSDCVTVKTVIIERAQ